MDSFISEHSAEFILVPNLIKKLAVGFVSITPIFFWATREGNRTAITSSTGIKARIVIAFARRPRIGGGSGEVFFKLNHELLTYAAESERHGIPVFAGVPLANSLPSLQSSIECAWVHLNSSIPPSEHMLHVDRKTGKAKGYGVDLPLLKDVDIVRLAEGSNTYLWHEMASIIRGLRRNISPMIRFPFSTGYRPFFLILWEGLPKVAGQPDDQKIVV